MSALAFKLVVRARERHDNGGCEFGARATAVHFNPAQLERCGWEDGDSVAGLQVVADSEQPDGQFKITCDGESAGSGIDDYVRKKIYA